MLPFIPKSASYILEIGCGPGGFGAEVKKRQLCEYWGLELNSHLSQAAIKKLDRVIEGSITEKTQSLPDNYFNCIIMNDVLEHLTNPGDSIQILKQKLKPNGQFICSIPNARYFKNIFEFIFKKDWEYKDHGILDKSHLRFFTKKSIQRFFNELNLDLVQIKGINTNHSINYYILNLLFFGSLNDAQHLQFACIAQLPQKK